MRRGWDPSVGARGGIRLVLVLALVLGAASCSPALDRSATRASYPVVTHPAAPPAVPGAGWVGAAPLAPSRPVRVTIPAIGVDSELLDLGLAGDGTMEVPPAGFPAGWYTGAPTPGELGPAVVVGHVDWQGPAVFHDLFALEVDDVVLVAREDGSTATFRVTRVEQYAKAAFPTEEVYGDIDHAGLRLITCGGIFNRASGSHEDNIVVFAVLT